MLFFLLSGFFFRGLNGSFIKGLVPRIKAQTISPTDTPIPTPTASPSAQITLRSLLQEHAVVGAVAFISRYKNSPDSQALSQQVNQNTNTLADFVSSQSGLQARNQFIPLWTEHIDALNAYVDAVKANNGTQKMVSLNRLYRFELNFTNFLMQYDNTLDKNAVLSGMSQHMTLETAIIEAYARNNYDLAYTQMHNAYVAAGTMADMNTGGMQPAPTLTP